MGKVQNWWICAWLHWINEIVLCVYWYPIPNTYSQHLSLWTSCPSPWTERAPRICTILFHERSTSNFNHIGHVKFWHSPSLPICAEEIYHKNQHCPCIFANNKGSGCETLFLFTTRNNNASQMPTFKNYQPVLVAKKTHIIPICKKPSVKLYITKWLNV